MKCSKCGFELSEDAKFCTECGTKVEDKKDSIFCENCGSKMNKDSLFCSECGTKVGSATVEVKKEIKKNVPKCPNCDVELEVDSMFCPECGTKIEKGSKKTTKKKEEVVEKEETTEKAEKVDSKKTKKTDNNHTATLTVTRKKTIKGCAITFHVLVDGVKVGDLKNGTSISCEVEEGIHKVTISTVDKDTDQPIEVTKDRNSIEIITIAKMGLIAAKADIVDVVFK